MFLQMILHWLSSVLPADLLGGWRLVRRDLLLWVALASLLAVAAAALPATDDGPAPILPLLVGMTTAVVTATLPPVLFTAATTGREVTWAQVSFYLVRRAVVMLVYWFAALFLAIAPAAVVGQIIHIALRGTQAAIPLSALGAIIVFLIFVVRFSFLPFLAILYERGQIREDLWSTAWGRGGARPVASTDEEATEQARPVARGQWWGPAMWPLVASTRLTGGVRWALTPYVLLEGIVPNLPRAVQDTLVLPVQVVCQILALVIQAVLYNYFRVRAEACGVPAPALIQPEE